MMAWGKRKLSDDKIREISKRIKDIPKKGRVAAFDEVAREFKCSRDAVQRIFSGYLTPKDIEKCKV